MMSARLLVFSGRFDHDSGIEMSAPSQVFWRGISRLCLKLGDNRVSVDAMTRSLTVFFLGAVPVQAVGPVVEGDPRYPDRTNVEFATVISPDRMALRVWERGVGETLACGTGAAAAVAEAHRSGRTGPSVTVVLPGGELLVEIVEGTAWIEGPANTVFAGSLAGS